MRRKGRSAGYLFAAQVGCPTLAVCFFLLVWVVLVGSAARKVVMGRFFRLGSVHNIVADDTRVPQLACFRLLRLLSDFGGPRLAACFVASVSGAGDSRSAILRCIGRLCVSLRQNYISGQIPPGRDAPPPDSPSGPVKISLPHYRYRV
jgi:hypothetical protein